MESRFKLFGKSSSSLFKTTEILDPLPCYEVFKPPLTFYKGTLSIGGGGKEGRKKEVALADQVDSQYCKCNSEKAFLWRNSNHSCRVVNEISLTQLGERLGGARPTFEGSFPSCLYQLKSSAFSFLYLYTELDILRVESFHNSQRRETVNPKRQLSAAACNMLPAW